MVRTAAALFFIALGLWAGYALWAMPAQGLGEALERVAIENDQLRTRLAERARDSNCDLSTSVDSILHRLSEQSDSLQAQTQLIAGLGSRGVVDRDAETQMEASLRACDGAQTKMQEQLERCLFAKADLERAAAAAKKAAEGPRPGRQTVTETIELPHIPGVTDGGAGGKAGAAIDARAVKPAPSGLPSNAKAPAGP